MPIICRRLARRLAAASIAVILLVAGIAAAPCQTLPDASRAPPPKAQELLQLLADPEIRAWLEQSRAADAATRAQSPAAEPEALFSELIAKRMAAIRQHIGALAAALPNLPGELLGAGSAILGGIGTGGLTGLILLLAVSVGAAIGAEWLVRALIRRAMPAPVDAPVRSIGDRLRAIGLRAVVTMCRIAAFALGGFGVFLVFDLAAPVREIAFGYLTALVVLRAALLLADLLLAPRISPDAPAADYRIMPVGADAARFWYIRIGWVVGWFFFGWATVEFIHRQGVSLEARRLIAYALGLGLVVMGIELAWRRPRASEGGVRSQAMAWLLSVYFIALWLAWATTAIRLFWLLVVVVALPLAIKAAQAAIGHVLRPPEGAGRGEGPSVAAILVSRAVRALLILGAAVLLTHSWAVNLGSLTQDTTITRLLRIALQVVIIGLVADVIWAVIKVAIDRRLSESQIESGSDSEEMRRRARLRTLLPLARHMVWVIVLAAAGLMILSTMGVEIGPLIAGAGVVGVAVGFGAQTLVRDIISGVFYLLDDAFRVGEYIQSGNYKGTVESFSLRSIKLRHHRGPLYTVPFGVLGAVQNMSRDWVIDKMAVGVTYDSDLKKAKKIIKDIGNQILADPELAPNIIETLKMQGIEQFGDFAIEIRMKMMTKPGEQFAIRRRAYALLKEAFDENGIKFAFPTVQVAGGDPIAAVAKRGVDMIRPAASG